MVPRAVHVAAWVLDGSTRSPTTIGMTTLSTWLGLGLGLGLGFGLANPDHVEHLSGAQLRVRQRE